jgi:hypothetical protein
MPNLPCITMIFPQISLISLISSGIHRLPMEYSHSFFRSHLVGRMLDSAQSRQA